MSKLSSAGDSRVFDRAFGAAMDLLQDPFLLLKCVSALLAIYAGNKLRNNYFKKRR